MTIAQRFIAGKKKDNTTVPSGRLNPTPKHTAHRNRSRFVSKIQCILPEMSSACDVYPVRNNAPPGFESQRLEFLTG
jgi:hypothetical protein